MDLKIAAMPNANTAAHLANTVAKDGGSGNLSATTISTIVVRAEPYATIVIGILKNLGFVQLRIDRMKPRLLELGANLRETKHLGDTHRELCVRLANKQSQVDNLLARADMLAATQTARDDAFVYAAMAESLSSTWRELTRQLELRGFLLDDTRQLFELAERHENAVERTNALISDTSNATRISVEDVNWNTALSQIQQSVHGLMELTAEAVDIGAHIITHIRVLGKVSNNEQRAHEIADACVSIENVMLKMASEWEMIDTLWKNERQKFQRYKADANLQNVEMIDALPQASQSNEARLKARLNVEAAWLAAARQTYTTTAASTGVASETTREAVALLLTQVHEHKTQLLGDTSANNFSTATNNLAAFYQNLLRDFDTFQKALEELLGLAERCAQFHQNVDKVLSQLSKMAAELRTSNASASMAGELAPLAYQKAATQIDEGQQILQLEALQGAAQRDTRDAIEEKLGHLRDEQQVIDELARAKISAAKMLNAKIQAQIVALSKWLSEGPEAFLTSSNHGVLGMDSNACAQFFSQHKKRAAEITAHEPELYAVLGHAQELAATDRKRCAELQRRFEDAREVFEARLVLARDFEQFHKFSREVSGAFNIWDQLLNGAASAQSVNNANVVNQVCSLQQTVREALQREKHHGEKFFNAANTISAHDTRLETKQACAHVESTILEHENRLSQTAARSDAWQSMQISAQNIIKVVEEVRIWERETEQLIQRVEDNLRSFDPSTSIDASNFVTRTEFEQLRKKCGEFERRIIEALERCPQMNRKATEARDATNVLPSKEAALSTESREFITKQNEKMSNSKEPFGALQKRLIHLREKIHEQTTIIETRVITYERQQEQEQQQKRDEQISHILQPLRNAQVEEGAAFEFCAQVDASPSARVIWLRNHLPLPSPNYRTEFLNGHATLRIDEAFVEDTALYTLRVENGTSVETSARLIVKPKFFSQKPTSAVSEQKEEKLKKAEKPHFVRQLQNASTTEGSAEVILDCVIIGMPEPKVIWYKEEVCIYESDRIQLRFFDDHCVLVIREPCPSDAGLYKVHAVNELGECVNFCRLNVAPASPTRKIPPPTPPKPTTPSALNSQNETTALQQNSIAVSNGAQKPPFFDIPLSNQIACEGERVLLQAHVMGSTELQQVAWFLDDERIPDNTHELCIENDVAVSGFTRLHILKFAPELAGIYVVVIQNANGEARSAASVNLANAPASNTRTSSSYYEELNVHQVPNTMAYNESGVFVRHYGEAQPQQRYFYRSIEAQPQQSHSPQSQPSTQPSPRPFTSSALSHSRDLGDMGYSSIATEPEFIRPFQAEYTVDEGERVSIDCLMVGNPRPRVNWTFNDRPLKSNYQFVELTNIGDTYAINFSSARLEHAGYYRLCAENVRGKTESLTLIHVRPRSMIPQPTFFGGAAAMRSARKTHSLEQQQMIDEFSAYASSPYYSTSMSSRATPTFDASCQKSVGRQQFIHQQFASNALQKQQQSQPQQLYRSGQVMSTSAYQPQNIFSPKYSTRSSSVVRTTKSYDDPYLQQHKQQQRYDIEILPYVEQTQHQEQQQQQHWQEKLVEIDSSRRSNIKKETEAVTQTRINAQNEANDSGFAPPHFTQTLVSCVVCVGDSAQFDALVSGHPTPKIEWFKDGEPLTENGTLLKPRINLVDGRPMLHFDAVNASDAGKYMCVAQNSSGMATSSAQLVVRPKTTAPDFTKRLISEEVMEGERLKWSVKIVGDPPPKIVWLRDGQPIPNCDDVRLVQESSNEHAMIIERVEAADAGQFTCLLENEAGEARSTADLVVRPAGTEPGSYFHITKVTQEKQLKGEELSQNEAICVEEMPQLQSEL